MRQFLTVRQTKKAVPFSRMCGTLVNGCFGFAHQPFVALCKRKRFYPKKKKRSRCNDRRTVIVRSTVVETCQNVAFILPKCSRKLCQNEREPNEVRFKWRFQLAQVPRVYMQNASRSKRNRFQQVLSAQYAIYRYISICLSV